MCGRFSLSLSAAELKTLFDIEICQDSIQSYSQTWNIAPSQITPAFTFIENHGLALERMRWGIPRSAFSGPTAVGMVINSRSENFIGENVYSKFLEKRCVIPATSYYEWMKRGRTSIPYCIMNSDRSCMFFAGIVHENENRNYSIMTAEATSQLQCIHHRMPFIMSRTTAMEWLHEKNIKASFIMEKSLAKDVTLEYYSVSPFVNSVSNNSEKCIERADYKEQMDLF